MKTALKILALLGFAAVAVLAFTPAHATCTGATGQCTASNGANSPNQNQQQHQSARSDARASAAAHSRSSSTAASVSNATGGNATSNAAGGDASGQQVTYEGSRTPRQTPPAFAGTVQPTASCKGAINAGASTPVAAVSFGKDRPDDECSYQWPLGSSSNFVQCRDGKRRPVEPGTFPLANGVSGRVGLLRGYGNAIVPQVAAAFIRAMP